MDVLLLINIIGNILMLIILIYISSVKLFLLLIGLYLHIIRLGNVLYNINKMY